MYLQVTIKVKNYLSFKGKKPCGESSAANTKIWSSRGMIIGSDGQSDIQRGL